MWWPGASLSVDEIGDLRIPPGNRLEKLKGDRVNTYGIRINDQYLEPLGVTQHRVAVAIGVPPRRINEIVHAKRGITADTALRLARYFDTSEGFWMNLQSTLRA